MASFGCKRITNSFGAAPSQIQTSMSQKSRLEMSKRMKDEKEQTWEEMISWTFELDTNFSLSLILKKMTSENE
jgi:hypothetical protein